MANGDTAPRSTPKSPSRLADALGLAAEDGDALRLALGRALTALGLDGAGIAARLDAGASPAEALSLPDGICDLLYARAHNWFSIGRYDKAVSVFRALCVLRGASRDHWLGYGICLKVRGEADAADVALRVAAQLDPSSPLPHYHRLDLAMRRGAWTEAERHLAEFTRRDGSDLPSAIVADADKYRLALSRRSAAGASGPSP